MYAIQNRESLDRLINLPVKASKLVDAVWSDYTGHVITSDYHRGDYGYSNGIILPSWDAFIDEGDSTTVDDLLKKTAGEITLGEGDINVLIADDNVEYYGQVYSELLEQFHKDLFIIARYYNLSLCVDRINKKYINMPLKAVW